MAINPEADRSQLDKEAKRHAPWQAFLQPKALVVLLLGFSSGLPLALTGSTLSLWMADRGVDLGTIGLFSLVGLPYVLKFLWAPLVDAVRIPGLTNWLGRRRAWLLATQLVLIVAIMALGSIDPTQTPYLLALAALCVATFSATQDIAIDAFRVESLGQSDAAAAMSNYVAAYRIAMLSAGAGTVFVVEQFENNGEASGWFWGYGAMAALMGLGVAATFWAREPAAEAPEQSQVKASKSESLTLSQKIYRSLVMPFKEFAGKQNWAAILLFVVLFKFGDAFAGAMLSAFALDIGFSKGDYAYVANGVGFPAALIGGVLGGVVAKYCSVPASLWIAGILQMVSNLVFVALAYIGPELPALMSAIGIENLTGGLGTVVFVAYLSSLCQAREFTATQFALLSALSASGRTFLAASSGYLAEAIGWGAFFTTTIFAALPGLFMLWWLTRYAHKRTERD
ncbi:MAG: AmpG family muropeptide MFS transporter [Parvibaculaceae bacterium]|nr:AmpG family muropeptide MFS transporter [Parvibaculaceae bacterium]